VPSWRGSTITSIVACQHLMRHRVEPVGRAELTFAGGRLAPTAGKKIIELEELARAMLDPR